MMVRGRAKLLSEDSGQAALGKQQKAQGRRMREKVSVSTESEEPVPKKMLLRNHATPLHRRYEKERR